MREREEETGRNKTAVADTKSGIFAKGEATDSRSVRFAGYSNLLRSAHF